MIRGIDADALAIRRLIGRHLAGRGVELGPGSQPFPISSPAASVWYLDRWRPDENRALFTEIDEAFTRPDIVCDLNTDRLSMLRSQSLDFVIASHVLEHVADPIGLLDEIHRVLRIGGIAMVLLPDMQRTFDRSRPVTPLEHLVGEHEAGVRYVDDAHIHEFLRFTEAAYQEQVVDADPAEQKRLFDMHRDRSIHVHCWSEGAFQPVIDHAIGVLGHRWQFVDGVLTDDEGPLGFEFGYVMRRTAADLPAYAHVQQFHYAHGTWAEHRRQIQRVQRELSALPPPAPSLRTLVRRWGSAVRRRLGR